LLYYHEFLQLLTNYFNLFKQKADDNYFCHCSFKSIYKLQNCDQKFKNVGLDIKEARKSNALRQWQIMEMSDILKQYTKIIDLKLMRIFYKIQFIF